jgi:hypothetical protein
MPIKEKGHFNVTVAIVKADGARAAHGLHFLVKEGDTMTDLVEYISEKSEYADWELEDSKFCFRNALNSDNKTLLKQDDGIVFVL